MISARYLILMGFFLGLPSLWGQQGFAPHQQESKLSQYVSNRQWSKAIQLMSFEKRTDPQSTLDNLMYIIQAATTAVSEKGVAFSVSESEFNELLEALPLLEENKEMATLAKTLMVRAMVRERKLEMAQNLAQSSNDERVIQSFLESYILLIASLGQQNKVDELVQQEQFKPYTDNAYKALARYYLDNKQTKQAIQQAKRITNNVLSNDSFLLIGRSLIEEGMPLSQALSFVHVFKNDFHKGNFISSYVRKALEKGEYSQAEKIITDIEFDPYINVQLWNELALKYIQQKNTLAVEKIITHLKSKYPDQSSYVQDSLWMDLGYYYLDQGLMSDTKLCIKKIESPQVQQQLVEAYKVRNRT